MTIDEKNEIMYFTHELMYIFEQYVEPRPQNKKEISDWAKRRIEYVNQNIFQYLKKTS